MCFLNKIISVFIGIILFIPLSFADEVISESLGDNLPRTAADTNIHEDKGLGSLPQLPLEVEFENSSNEVAGNNELIVSLKVNYAETDIFPTIVQNTQGHYLIPLEDIEHFDVQEDYLKQGLVNYHGHRQVKRGVN